MTSEARLFLNVLVVGLGQGGVIASCLFAWFKGGPAERYGAAIYFSSCMGSLALVLAGHELPTLAELALDAIVAGGFLWLAIRYNSLWLGAAMMIKGGQLALHAVHLTDTTDPTAFAGANLYYLALDLIGVLISLTIFFATLSSIRDRRRAASLRNAAGRPAAAAKAGLAPGR